MLSFLKKIYHYKLAFIGALIYGFPSKKLTVVGITGTKGKSTSVELTATMLREGGYKTASLSSAFVRIGDEVYKNPTRNTMPGRMFIQRFLARARRAGCTHAVIEVTSQGVVQYRHRFIDFDVVAITNLHPEHIESHGSFEAYRAAKVKFFSDVARHHKGKTPKFFVNSAMHDRAYFERVTGSGTTVHYSSELFTSIHVHNESSLSTWLRAPFNIENAALAAAISETLDVSPVAIRKVLETFQGVVGRAEFVRGVIEKQGRREARTALIDYALTPDSLRAIYEYAKTQLRKGGGLIAVFGSAGGGRDTWKRPALGKIAGEYCNKIYLTTDDPYDEDPALIARDIQKGIERKVACEVIIDRAQAITKALTHANENDIVVITGIGSQSYMYGPKGVKIPWSERKLVEEILLL